MAKKGSTPVPYVEQMDGDNQPLPLPSATPPRADERQVAVSFALPMGVLVALLDADHPLADFWGAFHYGLNDGQIAGDLTPMGELVRRSFDETAVRHKMLAAWRKAHNDQIDAEGNN